MGKSSPSAPTTPDPNVVAGAQTASNIATANANANLNRVNQTNPYGAVTWTKTPGVNGAADTWSQSTTLDAPQQALLDAKNNASLGLANYLPTAVSNAQNSLTKPLDFGGLNQVSYGNQNAVSNAYGNNGSAVNSSLSQYQNHSGYQPQASDYETSAQYGNLQNNLDGHYGDVTSNLSGLSNTSDLSNAMNTAQQAAYQQQAQYLDPQYKNAQHDLENQLVQQGVMQNSDAWNRAMDDFGRQKTQAYGNAQSQAIQLGNAAQNQLYNQALSSGNFANSAQNQEYNQSLQSGNFNNAAQNQGYTQALGNAGLNNSALNSLGSQYTANNNTGVAAAGTQSQYLNSLANNNLAQGSQNYNQSLGGRQQGINELTQQQNNPLSQLSYLTSGVVPSSQAFGSTPGVSQNGVDMTSLYQNQYNNQMGAYNAAQTQQNGLTGGLFDLGKSALGSPTGTFSGSNGLFSQFGNLFGGSGGGGGGGGDLISTAAQILPFFV